MVSCGVGQRKEEAKRLRTGSGLKRGERPGSGGTEGGGMAVGLTGLEWDTGGAVERDGAELLGAVLSDDRAPK